MKRTIFNELLSYVDISQSSMLLASGINTIGLRERSFKHLPKSFGEDHRGCILCGEDEDI
jgi:hypothetical protein